MEIIHGMVAMSDRIAVQSGLPLWAWFLVAFGFAFFLGLLMAIGEEL